MTERPDTSPDTLPYTLPHTTTPRADTGVTSGTLGIWLFVASETMLFGSLFSSYAILRSGADSWPVQAELLNLPVATVNTLVLLASSAAMAVAARAARAGANARCRTFAGLTLLSGSAFVALTAWEYMAMFGRGLRPATNNFLGLYYAMTGLHALHVVGGLVAIAVVAVTGADARRRDPARLASRMDVVAIYWHFVGAVWLCLFTVFYLL